MRLWNFWFQPGQCFRPKVWPNFFVLQGMVDSCVFGATISKLSGPRAKHGNSIILPPGTGELRRQQRKITTSDIVTYRHICNTGAAFLYLFLKKIHLIHIKWRTNTIWIKAILKVLLRISNRSICFTPKINIIFFNGIPVVQTKIKLIK